MNAEASARTKRERRRANEVKTRTIQRMQLRMVAPMDIGMEQNDDALRGQDDIFELDDAEKALRGKRSGAGYDDDSEDDSEEEAEEDNEVLDEDEERERKVAGLEAELDGLYDAYQEHLRERDAKWKVNEARRKSKAHEEWNGIGKGGDDAESDKEEGGYERIQRKKARLGEDSSDEEMSDEESDEGEAAAEPAAGKKRHADGPADSGSKTKKARVTAKVQEPKVSAPLSRSAELWFKQGLFADVDAEIEDDDEEVEEAEVEEEEEEEEIDEAMSGVEEEVCDCLCPHIALLILACLLGCIERRRRLQRLRDRTSRCQRRRHGHVGRRRRGRG